MQDFVNAVTEADDFVAKGAVPRGFSPSYEHPEPELLPAPEHVPARPVQPKVAAPAKPRVQKPKQQRARKARAEPLVRLHHMHALKPARQHPDKGLRIRPGAAPGCTPLFCSPRSTHSALRFNSTSQIAACDARQPACSLPPVPPREPAVLVAILFVSRRPGPMAGRPRRARRRPSGGRSAFCGSLRSSRLWAPPGPSSRAWTAQSCSSFRWAAPAASLLPWARHAAQTRSSNAALQLTAR